jgi:parallel beta-helix repeat protein
LGVCLSRGFLKVALSLLVVQVALADTFYVAPGGNNSNSGSSGSPWATLQFAADHVGAGDTVIARPGNYVGFDLREKSGTSTAPITFQADPGAIINQVNPKTDLDGINIEQASYIVVDGFTILSPSTTTRAGIRVVGDGDILPNNFSSHVTIRNNTATNWGHWGIFTGFSDDLVIERNTTSGSVLEHGIYVSNSADRPTVRYNHIYNNNANGIHMNGDRFTGDTSFPNVDGVITGARVEGNIIHGNGAAGGSGINCDGLVNAVIVNNLLYDNHASGISLYRIDGGAASTNGVIANNTIINALDNPTRWAINLTDGATGATIFNNIVYTLRPNRGSISATSGSDTGLISDYNLLEPQFVLGSSTLNSLAAWQTATLGQDMHSQSLTLAQLQALFTNYAGNDFTLAATSTARDFGASGLLNGTFRPAPSQDLLERLRPFGIGFDAGAYEFIPEPSAFLLLSTAGLLTLGGRRLRNSGKR